MLRLSALLAAVAAIAPVAAPAAQQNPFKLPKSTLKGAEITYELTGDMKGTATVHVDGDRLVRRSQTTMKMMGKTITADDWSLWTPDSSYHADLTRKQGYVMPNLLTHMAKAYDGLDGAGKKRFHQNMNDMATMVSRVFNLGSLTTGEKLGKKSYAGQECEERKVGGFNFCTMEKTPVVLHTSGTLVCINFEETATKVNLAAPAGDAFATPADITWKVDPNMRRPDSMAMGFVGYMASPALSDSLTKAKAELEKAKAEAAAKGQPAELTPEAQASMQAACQMMRDFDMGQLMAGAADAGKKAMANAAKNAAKNAAVGGLKGLIKKPKFP
jgi:hypothetical protein